MARSKETYRAWRRRAGMVRSHPKIPLQGLRYVPPNEAATGKFKARNRSTITHD